MFLRIPGSRGSPTKIAKSVEHVLQKMLKPWNVLQISLKPWNAVLQKVLKPWNRAILSQGSEFTFSPWIRVTQKDVDAVVE